MALRESENNAYAHYWGDKQRAAWCVMVFSVVVNRVVSVENIGLKPDCDIYADNVIAFCLYLINNMRGNVINVRRNVNTDDVIALCLHLVNKTRRNLIKIKGRAIFRWSNLLDRFSSYF